MTSDPLDGIDWQEVAQEIWLRETERRLADPTPGSKLLVSITVPMEHLEAYLQMLRTFDVEHGTDAAIAVLRVDPEEIKAIFDRIRPPFPFREEWKSD